jgi:hypothetical protein
MTTSASRTQRISCARRSPAGRRGLSGLPAWLVRERRRGLQQNGGRACLYRADRVVRQNTDLTRDARHPSRPLRVVEWPNADDASCGSTSGKLAAG